MADVDTSREHVEALRERMFYHFHPSATLDEVGGVLRALMDERDLNWQRYEKSVDEVNEALAQLETAERQRDELLAALEGIAHRFVAYRENLRCGAVDVSPETTLYTAGEIALEALASGRAQKDAPTHESTDSDSTTEEP